MSRLVPALCLGLPLLTACTGGLVDTEVRLRLDDPTATGSGLSEAAACGVDAAACTPTDLSGRIYSGGAMWGELGPDAWEITMLGATDDVILDPSVGMGGELAFSLVEQTVLAGRYAAPDPGDEARPISRMEFNFDWLDATFTLPDGSPLAGEWVLRTVFVEEAHAPDVQGVMMQGDKLIRRADDATFWWCDKDACSPDAGALAAAPMFEPALTDAPAAGEGNPNYRSFAVPLSEPLSLTGDALRQPDGAWTAVFDMTDAVSLSVPPAHLDGAAQLLAAAHLALDADAAPISVSLGFEAGE